MATADKLQKLLETKAAIRQAITNKGVEVGEDVVFADYPSKINAIEVGAKTNPYEELFNIRTNGGNYAHLFAFCNAESLDVSILDTSNVTDMRNMFNNCTKLTELDLSNFDTNNVTRMDYMFSSCYNLTSIDVSSFNTSNVTDMTNMFNSCNNLATLDLSNFDTSKVTNMNMMFYYCVNLTSLDLSNWDTSKVTNIAYAFQNCSKLTSLDVSNWDISKVTSSYAISNAFSCKELTDFKAPKNISVAIDFSFCKKLTHDSLMSIINNLATVTSTTKLTLGATNLAKLSDDEIAIAVNRGWTLA